MGKTRTASELAARAREAGVRVLACAAFEGETSAPYWPYTQLLRQARDELTADVTSKSGPAESVVRYIAEGAGRWSEADMANRYKI